MAYNLYNTNNVIELDLRKELRETLHGATGEIPKGRVGYLRKMRRDENGDLLLCPCRHRATTEPDRDYNCRICYGMGYFWDEIEIVYYKSHENDIFFVEYNSDITKDDYLIEVLLNKEGYPVYPLYRYKIYNIIDPKQYRADNARIEFWRIHVKYEREWSVHYGVKSRNFDN